jgi:dUTP pyrophosphatase
MSRVRVAVQRLAGSDDLPLPDYATPGSAGVDLVAALPSPLALAPGARAAVPTGLAIALPEGWEAQIRPRSGVALEHGITVLNAPGTVDADYRGEVKVILVNLGERAVTIERGRRIAQLVVTPVARLEWQEMPSLPPSARGAGGFGSTGR